MKVCYGNNLIIRKACYETFFSLPTTPGTSDLTDFCKRKMPQFATFPIVAQTKNGGFYSTVSLLLASCIPFVVAAIIVKFRLLISASRLSSCRRCVDLSVSSFGKITGLSTHLKRWQAHKRFVGLGAVRCSQWTRYSAAQCSACSLTGCAICPLPFSLL